MQLMSEVLSLVHSALARMWRRRWIGVLVAWLVGVGGIVGLLRTPDRYEATARVFVDTKSVLKPLMRDLAVEPDVDQTVSMLAKTIITRPNIERLVSRLEFRPVPDLERERLIDALQREIKISGSGRDNVFGFSYRDQDPVRAKAVVERLVSLFVESDLGAKARDVESAREFIDQQIRTYEVRLAEAETRLKDFKVRNLGIADSSGKDYFTRMSALTEELGRINVELNAAVQSRDALKRELTGEDFILLPDAVNHPSMQATPELDARLETQRRQLDELLRRYTDLHPDVLATRRLIARLEEQKEKELDQRRKSADSKGISRPVTANPVYQQIRLALAEAEASVAALRVRSADLQGRVAQLRASAARVPQVEAELAQLNRDYDIIRRNYEALVARRETAALSEDVDATRLANFRIIDPPRSSPRPVFPNRMTLAPILLLLSIASGAAASLLFAQLVPTFNSVADLRIATQRTVLGAVSALVTDDTRRRGRTRGVAFGLATVSLVVVYALWIAWFARATGQ